jgi:hypothetical protein
MKRLILTLGIAVGLYPVGTASAQYPTSAIVPRYPQNDSRFPPGYVGPLQNFYAGGAPVAVIRPVGYPTVGTPAFGYPGLGYPAYAPKANNATMFRGR